MQERSLAAAMAVPAHRAHGAEQPVALLNTAVPGRARLRVALLYRNDAACAAIAQRLCGHGGIQSVSANALTGTLLVLFDRDCPLETIVTHVADESVAVRATLAEAQRHANGQRVVRADFSGGAPQARHAGPPRTVTPNHQPSRAWHAMDAREVLVAVGSSRRRGLSESAAQRRLAANGPNALPPPRRRSRMEILLGQFRSLPVALLGASALASLLTGGLADAVVIMGVVLINAAIGYKTESETEREIAALNVAMPHQAVVLRNASLCRIDARDVVAGDILVLTAGAYVVADARLIESEHLSTDESVLTGESSPAQKQPDRVGNAAVALADRACMVYTGTTVVSGTGLAVVVAVGTMTEMGVIQTLVAATRPPATPMQRQLERFGSQTVRLAGALCALVFALGLLRGQGLLAMFRSAISLAVAAVPEGLPAVATTTLALGIRRMRQNGVLVRRLDAIETLGAVHTICFDKTGTLTANRMRVLAVHVAMERATVVDGALYAAHGRIAPHEHEGLLRLLHVAALCNDAELGSAGATCVSRGSSTEVALVEFAIAAGVQVDALRARYPRLEVTYRAPSRSYMTTLHRFVAEDSGARQRANLLAVKGNPAEVLALCAEHECAAGRMPLTEADRHAILAVNEEMGGESLRMLGFACATGTDTQSPPHRGLCWLGMLGLADPVRNGAQALIALLDRAGIRTVMITGDQAVTATAIGKTLRIAGDGSPAVVDAQHIADLEDADFARLAQQADIFARVSAANKLKIVRGLQNGLQRGANVTAMVGDGVNDGPALKAADISVAMGRHSTDLAREVADVVLEDDSLETLLVAIRQGRTTYANIRKAVHFLVSTNLSEIMVTLAAVGLRAGAAPTPMQLLWLNLLSDVFPALALSVEPSEEDVLMRPPRDAAEPLVRREDMMRCGQQALALSGGTLAAHALAAARHGAGARAGTVSFMTLTLGQLLHAYRCRSEAPGTLSVLRGPRNRHLDLAIGGMVALQALAALVPGLRGLLNMSPIDALDALIVALGATGGYLFNEATGRREGAKAGRRA